MKLGRALAWLAVLALFCLPPAEPAPRRRASAVHRLAGPIASLAASVEWIRFDLAVRAGRESRARMLAERALALDPLSARGWAALAHHLAHDRASSETDAAARRRAIEAGIEVLERGERASAEPGELAFRRGLLLIEVASRAAELDWPGGGPAALREARRALERAHRLGHPRAGELSEVLDRR